MAVMTPAFIFRPISSAPPELGRSWIVFCEYRDDCDPESKESSWPDLSLRLNRLDAFFPAEDCLDFASAEGIPCVAV
jgi:hypothetical protein